MVREKTLVKCDKCGSTNVVEEDASEIKVIVLTMDEYIEKNRSSSMFGKLVPTTGTSHMEKRILHCQDCEYTRLYDKVFYY